MAAALRPLSSSRASPSLRFLEGSGGAQGHAHWFDPDRLKDPEFTVDAYVSDLRQHAPLEALTEELEKYLATLKGKVNGSRHSCGGHCLLLDILDRLSCLTVQG